MTGFAGFDTSNYTTSAALWDADGGTLCAEGQLLPVREGELGVRQSDAVFHHVRQLPGVTKRVYDGRRTAIRAVGASEKPCSEDGSYMPCFLVGSGAAQELASVLGVPYYGFTHQQGHVMAALYGADCTEWRTAPFLAFHVSGGTTDLLLVTPSGETVIACRRVACSLDLKAGQLIDRIGGALGLRFPAGPALEEAALRASGVYRCRPSVENGCCHLSGVENQCRDRIARGEPPEEVALFCLKSIEAALCRMVEAAWETYGELPLLCAGGVMSNGLLRRTLSERYGGRFAPPALSRDNAAGIAYLTYLKYTEERENGR